MTTKVGRVDKIEKLLAAEAAIADLKKLSRELELVAEQLRLRASELTSFADGVKAELEEESHG